MLSTKEVKFLLGYFVPLIWRDVNELEFPHSLRKVNENCSKIVKSFEKYLLVKWNYIVKLLKHVLFIKLDFNFQFLHQLVVHC